MRQKRLLLLGGLRYLLPVIKEAHRLGVYVITADYLPDNIAHKYSDEYCNVSIIDKEAVLQKAIELKIDGIMSFAVDPGVVSAAYVAEKLNLPFQCSYEAACILQDKYKFRSYLALNGFNCPQAKGYNNIDEVMPDIDSFSWPVIVKPVDSAGSKGVCRVDTPEMLLHAVESAISESHSGRFIIEEFLEKSGLSAGSESFAIDGKLVFNGIYDQLFDETSANPFTPSAEIWPSIMKDALQNEMKSELQRLFSLLDIRTGLFNVEFRYCRDGKLYLMEVSPRAGGNRLSELLHYATGVNIIQAEVCHALGIHMPLLHDAIYYGHYAIMVLHPKTGGQFDSIEIDSSFNSNHVLEQEIRVVRGDKVSPFTGANASIGTLFLKFDTREELIDAIKEQDKWLKISVC